MDLSEPEKRLIEFTRGLGFGQFECEVKNGQPVMAHKPMQDIKFSEHTD